VTDHRQPFDIEIEDGDGSEPSVLVDVLLLVAVTLEDVALTPDECTAVLHVDLPARKRLFHPDSHYRLYLGGQAVGVSRWRVPTIW